MNASVKTRFCAFLIDILLVGILSFLVGFVLPHQNEIHKLEQQKENLNMKYLNHEVSFETYYEEYAKQVYQLDHLKKMEILIHLGIQFLYFVFVPFFMKGKTIGLFLLKAQIVSKNGNKANLLQLFLRSIILSGIGYLLLQFLLLFLLKDISYFMITTILGFIQILLVIISSFMVLYKKDALGLQDILSKTRVIIN